MALVVVIAVKVPAKENLGVSPFAVPSFHKPSADQRNIASSPPRLILYAVLLIVKLGLGSAFRATD